jgi:hypothetical protein
MNGVRSSLPIEQCRAARQLPFEAIRKVGTQLGAILENTAPQI